MLFRNQQVNAADKSKTNVEVVDKKEFRENTLNASSNRAGVLKTNLNHHSTSKVTHALIVNAKRRYSGNPAGRTKHRPPGKPVDIFPTEQDFGW